MPDASVVQDAICAIAGAGVRNASTISAATPSPVITSLVSKFIVALAPPPPPPAAVKLE